MVKRKALEPRWQAVLDIIRLQLSLTCPHRSLPNVVTWPPGAHLYRIHSEFQEMPGLSLTLGQASKIFGLPPDIVSRIFERLTEAHVLRQRTDGQFTLRVEEV